MLGGKSGQPLCSKSFSPPQTLRRTPLFPGCACARPLRVTTRPVSGTKQTVHATTTGHAYRTPIHTRVASTVNEELLKNATQAPRCRRNVYRPGIRDHGNAHQGAERITTSAYEETQGVMKEKGSPMRVGTHAAIEVVQGLGRSLKALLTLGKGTSYSRCWIGTMRWGRRLVVGYEQPRHLAETHGPETKRVL